MAHAINQNTAVVTKEKKITASNSKRVKVPNVYDNMGVGKVALL
ncbi:DUF4411 family protein [Proteiniphilum sp. UBA5384]